MIVSNAEATDALQAVQRMMESEGFRINARVSIAVDSKLKFAGYTSGDGKKQRIVVSGFVIESGGIALEALVAHELSHVYRSVSGHPSHNFKLLSETVNSFISNKDISFNKEVLFDAINHIEDIYADDVGINVLLARGESKREFLQLFGQSLTDWVSETPNSISDYGNNPSRLRWSNASTLLSNSFAIATMERHQISSPRGEADAKNEHFLRKLNHHPAQEKFDYFYDFMSTLPEVTTEKEFENNLHDYLNNFLDTINVI